jgi:predicted DNA-binding transcriptional regulator AlpA
MDSQKEKAKSERFAWPVTDWAHAVGLSRASVYNLLNDRRIASVKFGGKRLITTHPRDFVASLSEAA